MSLPDLLAEAVEGEDVVATVELGGEDALAVTPSRTLVYRAEGLLSDEAVEEYPHDVDRIDVSEGRRKAKLVLDYGLDGEDSITVPSKHLDNVLHPVLAGVLSASGITDPGESALRTFRFSELTLVVTSDRLVKHIGASVWDQEFEQFHYGTVSDLDFEEGTVATSVVLTHDGRQERFKAPSEDAPAVRQTLSDALCEFHDVESLAEFRLSVADEADEDTADEPTETASTTDFSEGLDPLSASPATEEDEATTEEESTANSSDLGAVEAGSADDVDSSEPASSEGTASAGTTEAAGTVDSLTEDALTEDGNDAATAVAGSDPGSSSVETDVATRDGTTADSSFDESGFEPAGVESGDIAEEIAELRTTVEAQTDRLDRQAELIETLVEELRRGR